VPIALIEFFYVGLSFTILLYKCYLGQRLLLLGQNTEVVVDEYYRLDAGLRYLDYDERVLLLENLLHHSFSLHEQAFPWQHLSLCAFVLPFALLVL
jgi:hypothetical protein